MPPNRPLRIAQAFRTSRLTAPHPNLASEAAAARSAPRSTPQRSAAHSAPPPAPPPRPTHTSFQILRQYGSYAFWSFCLLIFARDHLVSFDTVKGSSMAPTLSPNAYETGEEDGIVIQRNLRFGKAIQRGDVVNFWKPHRPEEISIKRVIAVEGDTVYPHRGYALDPEVVGQKRVEGWDGLGALDPDAVGGDVVEVGKVVVPKGHLWLEGDNWRKSYDSCDFGPVSLGLVDGKAVRVWRSWFRLDQVGDGRKREKGHWTRVVKWDDVMPPYSTVSL